MSRMTFVETEDDAIRFMKSVKFALRYDSTPGLPMASMYGVTRDQRRAIELTNLLLAGDEVIETNVIANRLVLVHRDIVPALYVLRVRFRSERLSDYAQRAFKLIQKQGSLPSGEVRRFLGVAGLKRPDPGDLALALLQREMLIDRGASSVPQTGIPYLSKEGYPYRIFEKAHPDLVKAATKIKVEDVVKIIREAGREILPKEFGSMFKLCLTKEEIRALSAVHP